VVTEPNGTETVLDGPDVVIDTVAPAIAITSGTEGTGDFFNAETHEDGVTLTGTGEPGARLTVAVEGGAQDLVIGGDGTWSVTFDATVLGAGDYIAAVTLTAMDAVGNTTVVTDSILIDTVPNALSIAADTVEGDGVVNAAEAADGVTVTGSSEPGATVEVTLAGAVQTAVTGADGAWSVTFPAAGLPAGEYDAQITAVTRDAVGNVTTVAETIRIDTVGAVAIDPAPVAGDNVINAAEAAGGMALTGTSQPGSVVEVAFAGVTRAASVAADGSWSVAFSAAEIPPGSYHAAVTVTATDGAGNISTARRDLTVDTEQTVTIDTAAAGGDGVINAAEAAGGVVLGGTAQPGSSVAVTLGGTTRTALAGADGSWQAAFLPGDIPAGEYQMTATAVATDAAGNTATATGSVRVDTEVTNHHIDSAAVEGDDVINAAERADGVTLTGTTEPGSSVLVTLGGVTRPASVAPDGSWSVDFAAADIPTGEYSTTLTAQATDPAGNVGSVSRDIAVDTLVRGFGFAPGAVEGDDVINAAEAQDGFALTGTAEPGSTVSVAFGGASHAAAVDGSGNWSVTIPAAAVAPGSYAATAVVTATDPAGNTDTISRTVTVDTEGPDAPLALNITYDSSGDTTAIATRQTGAAQSIEVLSADGSLSDAQYLATEIDALQTTLYSFGTPVPDGSDLVITGQDAAGNTAGTLVALDDAANPVVSVDAALAQGLQLEAIDLSFDSDAQLTLTEAQLLALSDTTDTLTIHGNTDDTVTISGAVRTGATQQIEGQTYDIYTLGDNGGTLIIDDDVRVVI
jgi:hypothetical protein